MKVLYDYYAYKLLKQHSVVYVYRLPISTISAQLTYFFIVITGTAGQKFNMTITVHSCDVVGDAWFKAITLEHYHLG